MAFSNVDQGLQLSVTLQANKTRFAQGEIVNMTFTLTNISNQTVNVINLNNFSFFNFYIYDNKNNLVGARNIGAAGMQNITIHLAPKENYAEIERARLLACTRSLRSACIASLNPGFENH